MQSSTGARPPRPIYEVQRVQALYRSRALGIESEARLDDAVHLAAYVTGAPIASINLLDEEEQFSPAAVGVDPGVFAQVPRDAAVCSYTILSGNVLHIPDLTEDPRTRDNDLLLSFGVRHYTGAPILTADGHGLGALCVFDLQPRQLTVEQRGALGTLARQVGALLEWRNSRNAIGGLARRRAAYR